MNCDENLANANMVTFFPLKGDKCYYCGKALKLKKGGN